MGVGIVYTQYHVRYRGPTVDNDTPRAYLWDLYLVQEVPHSHYFITSSI
jgi:hypothetical protein